ncbi:MAG: MltA domain-containing protein [Rubrivivax sp.]
MLTGYFEPLVEASRTRRGAYQVPLHQPPADLPAQASTGRASMTRCPPRPRRCAAARSPTWPTWPTRWCCRSRARGG